MAEETAEIVAKTSKQLQQLQLIEQKEADAAREQQVQAAENVLLPAQIFALKGKRPALLSNKEPSVHLVHKKRQGKCFGAAKLPVKPMAADSTVTKTWRNISTDIWFHVADHIAPETVLNFALICRQTAAQVNCKKFWNNLYAKYCQKDCNPLGWNPLLPAHLQHSCLQACHTLPALRQKVVQALFHCYPLFVQRQMQGHGTQVLIGSIPLFINYAKPTTANMWFTCYKFCNRPQQHHKQNDFEFQQPPVANWEALLDNPIVAKDFQIACDIVKKQQNYDSIENHYLLGIYCKDYVPTPVGIFEKNMRLKDMFNKLNNDMRSQHLELQFVNVIDKSIIKVKYPCIREYFVVPWWYTTFENYENFDTCKLNNEF